MKISLTNWFTRSSRRSALKDLIAELYFFNERDGCYDPIGSIDYLCMKRIIEVIARDRLERPVARTSLIKHKQF